MTRQQPPAAASWAPAPPNAVAATPTLRAVGRRAAFWIVAGTGALVVAIVATLFAAGASAAGPPLAADNPAPAGSMALVEVLREQGVTVTVADTLAEARSAAAGAADPTVFFHDDAGYLGTDKLEQLAGLAPRLVVAAPDFRSLQALAPSVGFGGVSGEDRLSAQCPVPAAAQAGTISPGGPTLTIPTGAPAGLIGCFPSGDRAFSVIERSTDAASVTLVADPAVFANDTIPTWGNAALALNLLGAGDTVVWYLPTLADVPRDGPPSLGALTPGWVTPTIVLLSITTLCAFVWRGRRFGPLVAENLPVTVKASETMEGRARLYARGSTRLRALDALRIGTVQRLAVSLGLGRSAGLDDIVRGVSAATGRPQDAVRAVLVDAVPATDRELLTLSDRLAELERATKRGAAPDAAPPADPEHGRMEP